LAFGIEVLNNKFDPLGVNLTGWSQLINSEIENYGEVFE
tara:strand:- start:297 stop:413 length:117 start_codon:yes stop_codon:yes gene_type:complete